MKWKGDKSNKRGDAHFEMIISFTFFIGFVLFLFMTLNPQSNSPLFSSVIVSIQDDFKNANSVNFGSVFLEVSHNRPIGCIGLDFSGILSDYNGGNSLVQDLAGIEIDSDFDGSELRINSVDKFFRVHISEEFEGETLIGCFDIDSSYELGSVVEREVVSYRKLIEMNDSYYSDYEGLKEDLRIPTVFDFAIVPYNLSEIKMSPVNGVPQGVEVLARDGIFEILKSDGSLQNERISFWVW